MSWSLKPRADIVLPEPSPHWHPPGCGCELAVPYIRVSKVGKREQVISPKLQLDAIEVHARRNNLRLLPPVCDIDRSGRTFRKRSVDQIIKEIKRGEYGRVVLWKWSRWARNVEESAKYSAQIRDAGGRVESATEDEDLDSAVGRLKKHMIQGFDQYQSDLIAEGWQGVLANRRELGLPHGGRDRFGYDYLEYRSESGHRAKKYVPNADKDLVVFAYQQYVEGVSLNDLMRHFNKAGAKTAFGKAWTAQSLARMLDTGFAAGLIRERSNPGDKPSNSIKDYDVWRVGAHEAVIGADLWRQFKAKRLAVAGTMPPRSRKAVHELSALLFCGVCRRRLVTKYAGRDKKHQWVCPWQRVLHPGVAVGISNSLAVPAVREWVRDIVGGKIDVAAARAEAVAELARDEARRSGEVREIRDRIAEIEAAMDNLLDMAEKRRGRAREKIDERIDEYETELQALRVKIGPAEDPAAEIARPDEAAFQTLDSVWEELPAGLLRDSLRELVSRIVVGPRTSESSRASARDRVIPAGVWELPSLESWYAERPSIPA